MYICELTFITEDKPVLLDILAKLGIDKPIMVDGGLYHRVSHIEFHERSLDSLLSSNWVRVENPWFDKIKKSKWDEY